MEIGEFVKFLLVNDQTKGMIGEAVQFSKSTRRESGFEAYHVLSQNPGLVYSRLFLGDFDMVYIGRARDFVERVVGQGYCPSLVMHTHTNDRPGRLSDRSSDFGNFPSKKDITSDLEDFRRFQSAESTGIVNFEEIRRYRPVYSVVKFSGVEKVPPLNLIANCSRKGQKIDVRAYQFLDLPMSPEDFKELEESRALQSFREWLGRGIVRQASVTFPYDWESGADRIASQFGPRAIAV